jgi:hypothetical protein
MELVILKEPASGQMYRRTFSTLFAYKLGYALTSHLASCFFDHVIREGLTYTEYPDAVFISERRVPPERAQGDFSLRALQFECVPSSELHFVSHGLGQHNSPSFIEC